MGKHKMNNYERHAYLYSAWVAMIVPMITAAIYLTIYFSTNLDMIANVITISLGTGISTLVVFAALGFFMRETFRQTSKLLFQFSMFKEDETKMPTTEMLIYKNHIIAKDEISEISAKLQRDFQTKLPTEEEQIDDEKESRLRIVHAVGLMRNVTRGNKILEQANYRYGFRRNMLGGLVWAMLFQTIILIAILFKDLSIGLCLIGYLLIAAQSLIAWSSLKPAARNYAKVLFDVYRTTKI